MTSTPFFKRAAPRLTPVSSNPPTKRAYRRRPTAERGYGALHQRIRRELAPIVAAGLARCARCFEPIAAGEPWDLGHDDADRSRYSGPEHRRCNRATAASVRRRVSRRW